MKILLASAIAMTALVAPSAHAQTVPVAKVFYGDLDINNAAGMATLTSRIKRAAQGVCSGNASAGDLASRTAASACYRAAVEGAMKQMPSAAPQFASR